MAEVINTFGFRQDGTPKSTGYLGRLKNKRGDVVTEFSIDEDVDGKRVHMPSIVPTLDAKELQTVLKATEDETVQIPNSVFIKAVDHAKKRIKEGKSPFWNPKEDGDEVPAMPDGSDPQTFLRSLKFQFNQK